MTNIYGWISDLGIGGLPAQAKEGIPFRVAYDETGWYASQGSYVLMDQDPNKLARE